MNCRRMTDIFLKEERIGKRGRKKKKKRERERERERREREEREIERICLNSYFEESVSFSV